MDTIVVYCNQNSPRLEYVSDWLFRERLQLNFRIVTDIADITANEHVVGYGVGNETRLSVPMAGLLAETGTHPVNPDKGKWNGIPTFFDMADAGCSLPFDMFSAIFYLLSRYEEYQPYEPDKHGRYPAVESILYKSGVLSRPVVDEWVATFRNLLSDTFDISLPLPLFTFRPTYDIDMAYSHLHKGFGRIAGAYIKALLKIDIRQITTRTKVLKKKQKDPYDSFRWLRQLHKEYGFSPAYFILSAQQTTKFDRNIHPEHPAMVRVIKNLVRETGARIGIHPSYYSDTGDVMKEEKALLEQILKYKTRKSRQHYIRLKIPNTYRLLLKNNITEDYSMGYGSHLGFRAGTGCSFMWYDIENEAPAPIRVFPFCFMDTTAHYEMGLPPSEAFDLLRNMSQSLEETGSMLITVFHNFSLGTDEEWSGWRQAYELFMAEHAEKQNRVQRSVTL